MDCSDSDTLMNIKIVENSTRTQHFQLKQQRYPRNHKLLLRVQEQLPTRSLIILLLMGGMMYWSWNKIGIR